MRYLRFDIKNYKGIKSATLDLSRSPTGQIYSLVGLNESGKTTLLEAISFFDTKDEILASVTGRDLATDPVDLIPTSKKFNFNGRIEVSATIELDVADKREIIKRIRDKTGFRVSKLSSLFTVTRFVRYKNSIKDGGGSNWKIDIIGKSKSGRIERDLFKHDKDLWIKSVNIIVDLFPPILYFPTFLYDIPEKIFLEESTSDTKIDKYFRSIAQDILSSIDKDLDIETHIVERSKDDSRGSSRALQDVLKKMQASISRMVFRRWNAIFDKNVGAKRVTLSYGVDEERGTYLEMIIEEGESDYYVSERSLGFRWFFCFLLFTEYRLYRKEESNVIFMFDEPASNLHPKAQTQLLGSFERLAGDDNVVLYSTHSHHMIRADWLENCLIVVNNGINYDDYQTEYDYNPSFTDISIARYRTFANENPGKGTYFQPILDALDYTPGELEIRNNAVLVEGKSDFYMLRYFDKIIFKNDKIVSFVPGTSASGLDPIISILLGWGVDFSILLDDDKEGKLQASKYIDDYHIPDRVFTMHDVSSSMSGYEIESLLLKSDLDMIKAESGVQKVSKKVITKFFQEALAKQKEYTFTKTCTENIKEVIDQFRT
jgi:predicted ATP-dependent endonuclease of OLD family